jgi:acyl-CoA synthetase (AMP-forming)/AMP-acid ligase II
MIVTIQRAGQADLGFTYHTLMLAAAGYAQALARQGVAPGQVVVIILKHGPELLQAFLGSILHGAIPAIMPFLTEKLLPERYRADLATLFSVTQPSAVVTSLEFESEVRAATEGSPSVRTVILADRVAPALTLAWEGLAGQARCAADLALLQHSSGTTGLQKGVALSHAAVLNQLSAFKQVTAIGREDVVVSWLPLYHDMGLIAGFLLPVLVGAHLVLMSPFDWVRAPHRLLRSVSEYGGTLSWLPNFAFNFSAQKVRDTQLEGVDLSSWRAVVNCSEPVRLESHQAFLARFQQYGLRPQALQTSYAMAENVFAVTQSQFGASPAVEVIDRHAFLGSGVVQPATAEAPALSLMSSGRPLKNVQVRVISENGLVLPDRTVGELSIRSDCMLDGYYNRPDATGEALRDGWLQTGDYGYISLGEVFVSGRKKDVIIVGGKNVYAQDIEALASEVDGVHPGRVVAFGQFREEQGTEEVVLVVEADLRSTEDREQLAANVRKYVTQNSDIALRRVAVVDDRWIVKTSSGKTARGANKEKFLLQFEV